MVVAEHHDVRRQPKAYAVITHRAPRTLRAGRSSPPAVADIDGNGDVLAARAVVVAEAFGLLPTATTSSNVADSSHWRGPAEAT
jgi:hypothetical protein